MMWLYLILAILAAIYLGILWWVERGVSARALKRDQESREALELATKASAAELSVLKSENARLQKWAVVEDADGQARALLAAANASAASIAKDAELTRSGAVERARQILSESQTAAGRIKDEAEEIRRRADAAYRRRVAEAEDEAKRIAGKAFDAMRDAEQYERTARAMKRIIEGYGDEYIQPAESLLDDLATEYSHKEAGVELKRARDATRRLIAEGKAGECDYVEVNRREMAIAFVLDAFNGKVDSILSRVKDDNAGKLSQEIQDAFEVVNYNGKAFRDARVTDALLQARLSELRWAAIAQHLKKEEQEEQRRLREQVREEERARREYERAIRESEKEEKAIRTAMERARLEAVAAAGAERAALEQQLRELEGRLAAAEEKNQRAISMAQQTRRGHVYIVSNIGSLGENVYKIGLTRRLDPLERIYELGDSSVPFDFDVHAMIFAEDAPALEHQLHNHFLLNQVNKVNHRKEFFRANLADIRSELERMGIDVKWTMVAEATEYRETLAIERRIAEDPKAREAWINRQLLLDPNDLLDSVEQIATESPTP